MDYEALAKAVGELDEDAVKELLAEVSDAESANRALEACQAGMNTAGELFEEGEYFVGDLIFAGELMTDALDVLKPFLAAAGGERTQARMIMGTVKGDVHDIGKNIVRSMLEAAGFDVLDLGIDVPPEKIVETARAEDIRIIALSGVLTLALDSMKETVEAFKAAGLRDGVKILIGGAPVTEEACAFVGADDWATSPHKTISVCQTWAKELES